MPGIYIAQRDGAIGRAGLALPYTPTPGPIRFAQDWNLFTDVPMHHHYLGLASGAAGGGLCTHLISECAVFVAAEYNGGWRNVYFAHIQGGDWSGLFAGNHRDTAVASRDALTQFAATVGNLNNCFTLAVCPGPFGYGGFLDYPRQLGFPAARLSHYVSNTARGLGVAVEFRTMGEFGEIDDPVPQPREGPYGPRPGDPYDL